MKNNADSILRQKEELEDLLEDLLTKIQELRDVFSDGIDDLEDMITER